MKKNVIRNSIKTFVNNQRYLYLLKVKIQHIINSFKKPISGNNNLIQNRGVFFKVKFDIIGNNNTIKIGKKTKLYNTTIFIRGDNHILIIDEDCIIKGGSFWFEDSFCKIHIGKETTIESADFAVTENESTILIGADCMFSDEIVLRTGDSHAIIDQSKNIKINNAQDIIIGNHVWIGSRSTILKGVVIGDNTVIGTGSIVTKSVLCNTVSVGIPARMIKSNVGWSRNRFHND
ncbi:acyltransferase [Flavobacteriaceae bacterium]|nr:acyltransferase [Flavobacteriaceae bacterium]